MRGLAAGAAVAALGLAAATASAQTAPAAFRPANLHPAADSPEGGLWDQSDRAERYIKASAELESDPVINAYVKGVICKLAAEYCGELRLYVVDRPFLNAGVFPNGYVEVNSGLLLRARDEDDLAYVLGHEISHFARNHSLARWSAQKRAANVSLVVGIGLGAVATGAAYSVAASGTPNAGYTIRNISTTAQQISDLVYLSGIAGVFAFSRDEESEADRLGFERARAAGYRPDAGPGMWGDVVDETRASDFKRVRDSEGRASIFDTHPVTADRIAALKALETKAQPSVADKAAAARAYRARIRPHLAAWLADDLRRRDFGQTLYLLDRLDALGEDKGVLAFARGEAYRKRREDGDDRRALRAYREAIAAADAPPEAWREAGEAELKAGDKAAAKVALAAYVEKRPEASDRWMIDADLKTLTP